MYQYKCQITQVAHFPHSSLRGYLFILVWSVTASVFFLMVIAGDRFMAIKFPFRARVKGHWSAAIFVVVWVVSAACAAPYLWVWELRSIEWMDGTEVWCEEVWPSYYFETEDGECSRQVGN